MIREGTFRSLRLPLGWWVLDCPECERPIKWQWLGGGWTVPQMWRLIREHLDDKHPNVNDVQLIEYSAIPSERTQDNDAAQHET